MSASAGDDGESSASNDLGHLKKRTLTRFIRSGCKRQLLLDVGKGDPRWVSLEGELHRAEFQVQSSQVLFDLGHDFEQSVYDLLKHELLRSRYTTGAQGMVETTDVSPEDWRAIADEFVRDEHELCFLLEHQFDAPEELTRRWLQLESGEPVPILDPQHHLRPDITLLYRPEEGQGRRLRSNASCSITANISSGSLRTAINFYFDVFSRRRSLHDQKSHLSPISE